MDPQYVGMIAALMSAASWALAAILFSRLGDELSSFSMTLIKGGISIALLLLVMGVCDGLARGGLDVESPFSSMSTADILLLVVSGLLGVAVADTCFFAGLKDLGPHSLIMMQALGLVLTPIGAVLFLDETRTLTEWGGIGLIVTGVVVVLYGNMTSDFEQGKSKTRGILFGSASVLFMSISFVIAKPALDRIPSMQATVMRMLAGSLGLLIVGLINGSIDQWVSPFSNRKLARDFFVAVCVVTFGGFWLSHLAMKELDISVATPFISTEPLFALGLGATILHRRVTGTMILGTLTTIIGVLTFVWK